MVSPKIKRITANIPEELMNEAIAATRLGITETLIEGLRLVKRAVAHDKATALKGRLDLRVDLDVSRERSRR